MSSILHYCETRRIVLTRDETGRTVSTMTTTHTATGATTPPFAGTPPAPAVRVRGLRRTYGQGASAYEAVRGVDLDVPAGSITALLGTNGAGKTSTLEVLEGLVLQG